MCILFCHPQFHGGMFLLFLCFSSPRIMVFAEKGIFIFMIFRGGSAHLTANPSCPGLYETKCLLGAGFFLIYLLFGTFRGGVLRRSWDGWKGRQRTIHTYTCSYVSFVTAVQIAATTSHSRVRPLTPVPEDTWAHGRSLLSSPTAARLRPTSGLNHITF